MARPSRNTDLLLLKAGRELIAEKGLTSLRLRQVADRAGVNLGMFKYHFDSKEEFLRRVLRDQYQELLAHLEKAAPSSDTKMPPLQRLKRLLRELALFIHEHREIIASLVHDGINGEPLVFEFVRKNGHRHVGILLEAIRACQKKSLLRRDLTPLQIAFICMSQLGMPVAALTAMQRGAGRRAPRALLESLIAPELIEVKIEILLKGLRQNGKTRLA